jgi:hypothetical protein
VLDPNQAQALVLDLREELLDGWVAPVVDDNELNAALLLG